ncbi:MAG TPA: glutathione S-transferase family protein [Candidatus Binatia bacterium]
MELFDNIMSPYAFKVRLALYEKGIKFDKHEIRTHADRERLLEINPRGEVPALCDGDAVLYDSAVICEYLDDRIPPSLLPDDPAARARVRLLEKFADGPLDGAVLVLGVMKAFRPDLVQSHPEAARTASEVLQRCHAQLEHELGANEYLAGATLTRADIAVVPHLIMAELVGDGIDGAKHPRLAAWLGRMRERGSVQRATHEALEAFREWQSDPDPLFSTKRLHWRSDRIEAALRVGLGPWLVEELAADRAFLPPVP